MTEQEIVTRFERCELAASEFGHREHVHLAWLYLRRDALLPALNRFATGLKRFAAHLGAKDKYNETITWAYMLLIHDRMEQGDAGWSDFCSDQPRPAGLEGHHPQTLLSREHSVF